MTIRNVFYYGSINNTSDPALKEQIELANVSTCYETIRTLPLRRFKYTDAYISSFQLQDIHRLGVLSTEVGKHFPKSITPIEIPGFEGPIQTVDMQQVDMAHIGATKYLMDKVDTLTRDIEETLQQISSYKG
jgi:hypothetical protein